MAGKKHTGRSAAKSESKSPAVAKVTPVRNTPLPKVAQQPRIIEITYTQIAVRAYEIWQSGQGGSELENWLRAEKELHGH